MSKNDPIPGTEKHLSHNLYKCSLTIVTIISIDSLTIVIIISVNDL